MKRVPASAAPTQGSIAAEGGVVDEGAWTLQYALPRGASTLVNTEHVQPHINFLKVTSFELTTDACVDAPVPGRRSMGLLAFVALGTFLAYMLVLELQYCLTIARGEPYLDSNPSTRPWLSAILIDYFSEQILLDYFSRSKFCLTISRCK